MKNINNIKNKYMVSALEILAILTFILLMALIPSLTHAQSPTQSPTNEYGGVNYKYGNVNYPYTVAIVSNNNSNVATDNNNGSYSNLTPVIYNLSQNSTKAGLGTFTIDINGNNFTPNSVAKINGSDRPTTFYSANLLRMTLYAADTTTVGSRSITVFNPTSTNGYSNAVIFNVTSANTTTSRARGTSASNSISRDTNTSTTTLAKTDTTKNTSGSVLGASAVGSGFGGLFSMGGRFFPASLVQWLVLFILILIVVVLWRQAYLGEKDHNKPLKHA